MNNDKLLEAAIEDITSEICGEFGTPRHIIWRIVFDAIIPLFPAPEPVDDKAMTEALKQLAQLRYNSTTVDACAIDTVLAALRAAQQEAQASRQLAERTATRAEQIDDENRLLISKAATELDELREWKRQQLEVEATWSVQAVGKLLGVPIGESIRPAIAPRIEALQSQVKELWKDKERLDWMDERGPFDSWDRREEAHVTIRRPVRETIDKARAAGEQLTTDSLAQIEEDKRAGEADRL